MPMLPSNGDTRKDDSRSARVLMVLDSYSFGGAENLIAELGRHAPPSLSISVASLAPAEQGRNAMVGRLVEAGLQPTYLSVRKLLDPRGFISLVRTLRRSAVDVVHAHLGYSAILVPLAARLAGKPVVATLHVSPQRGIGRGEWLKERLSVVIPARLGRIVFVSQHVYDRFAQRHGPARPTWQVIWNGIGLEPYAVTDRADSPTKPPVWAMVAALRPDKNHLDLIAAWEKVVAVRPDATLLIVGDGPCREKINRAIVKASLTDSVQLLGRREDVPAILRDVDGVVSASIDEALPTALIEAGASGLPVVAADAGGTREIVIDGVTGRVVPLRDIPAMADALLSIIDDPALGAAYGAAARSRIEENFSMTSWVGQLERLYEEIRRG